MSLPPYLLDRVPPPEEPPDPPPPTPTPPPAPRRKRRGPLLALVVAVAILAGAFGAVVARATTSSDPATAPPATIDAVTRRLGRVGVTEALGDWRILVVNWDIDTSPRLTSNVHLIARVTLTNAADAPRTWYAPEQIALRYQSTDGGSSGSFVRSPDELPDDFHRVGPHANATVQYGWHLPADASGFVLVFRNAVSTRNAEVNLTCC